MMERSELERIYDEHASCAFALFRRFAPCDADARDLLQDWLVKIARGHDSLADIDKERAYLMRIAYRHAVDWTRSLDSLVPEFLEEIPQDLLNPGSPLIYAKGLHGDRYRIYSVGKNLDDDDGTVVFGDKPRDRRRRNFDEGDWVWGYSFGSEAND